MRWQKRTTLADLSKPKPLGASLGSILRQNVREACVGLALVFVLLSIIRHVFMPLPSYQSRTEQGMRRYRFPSVDERLKIYMSDWYQPPRSDQDRVQYSFQTNDGRGSKKKKKDPFFLVTEIQGQGRSFEIQRDVNVSTIFYYNIPGLTTCGRKQIPIAPYCSESMATMGDAMQAIRWKKEIPILLQFGDEDDSRALGSNDHVLQYHPRLPHIKKFRKALTKQQLELKTLSSDIPDRPMPIIWKLNAKRHYRDLYLVPRNDRVWSKKLDKAVFRGALTGKTDGSSLPSSDQDKCMQLPRCRLVYQTANSQWIDAKLTKISDQTVQGEIDGVNLHGSELSMRQMLAYKVIVILEGNDVSSGLKWALLSQSVVLMPSPKFNSWAMEERLEPWIHYIPLHDDLSDVEDKIQWAILHPSEAQRISHRASLWIKDLVFHPEAKKDDASIYKEILRRYSEHFA